METTRREPPDGPWIIREATLDDIPQIVRCTVPFAAILGEKLNQKVVRDGVTQFIQEGHHGRYFLAVVGGSCVGQIIVKPVILEPWRDSRVIWVDDFVVDPDYTQTDLMQDLLRESIRWAVANEREQVVRLFCPHTHPAMMRALLCLGFDPIGILFQQRQDYFFDAAVSHDIREATLEDAEGITHLTMELATSLGDEPNQKIVREGVLHFLREETHGKYFLAAVDGKTAGQVVIKPVLLEPWKKSRIVWVDDAYVRPAFRGQNILKSLLLRGIAWGAANEHEQIVRLYAAFTNREGMIAWLSLGFAPIGYMMQQRQDYFFSEAP